MLSVDFYRLLFAQTSGYPAKNGPASTHHYCPHTSVYSALILEGEDLQLSIPLWCRHPNFVTDFLEVRLNEATQTYILFRRAPAMTPFVRQSKQRFMSMTLYQIPIF